MNAVQLICKSGVNGAATYIQSLEGKWGSWGRDHVCRETPAIAFAIQVERFQGRDKEKGSKDDTAAGNIKMNCGSEILVGDPPVAWGDWTGFYSCLDGTGYKKIRGFRTQVEPDQGSGDDTAMNAMQSVLRALAPGFVADSYPHPSRQWFEPLTGAYGQADLRSAARIRCARAASVN